MKKNHDQSVSRNKSRVMISELGSQIFHTFRKFTRLKIAKRATIFLRYNISSLSKISNGTLGSGDFKTYSNQL